MGSMLTISLGIDEWKKAKERRQQFKINKKRDGENVKYRKIEKCDEYKYYLQWN